MRTEESPMGLGRCGEREAKTPTRVLPPRRGGRTVGEELVAEDCHIIHIKSNPSRPLIASGVRKGFSNIIVPGISLTTPAWRGMPNLVGKGE